MAREMKGRGDGAFGEWFGAAGPSRSPPGRGPRRRRPPDGRRDRTGRPRSPRPARRASPDGCAVRASALGAEFNRDLVPARRGTAARRHPRKRRHPRRRRGGPPRASGRPGASARTRRRFRRFRVVPGALSRLRADELRVDVRRDDAGDAVAAPLPGPRLRERRAEMRGEGGGVARSRRRDRRHRRCAVRLRRRGPRGDRRPTPAASPAEAPRDRHLFIDGRRGERGRARRGFGRIPTRAGLPRPGARRARLWASATPIEKARLAVETAEVRGPAASRRRRKEVSAKFLSDRGGRRGGPRPPPAEAGRGASAACRDEGATALGRRESCGGRGGGGGGGGGGGESMAPVARRARRARRAGAPGTRGRPAGAWRGRPAGGRGRWNGRDAQGARRHLEGQIARVLAESGAARRD